MSQIGQTFKHALIYSASGMIGKIVGFIMLPVYANYLRGEGYGIIGMIDVVLSVATLLVGYGIQGAMARFYFEKKGDIERKEIISTAIIMMFVLVVVVSSPLLLFNEQVATFAFGEEGMGDYIILAIITFMATMTSKSAEMYILIRQQSLFYASLSLCKLCLELSLNVYLIVYLRLGILGYLYSGLIAAIIFSAIFHFYALFNVGIKFVKTDGAMILRYSLPLLPGYFAMFIRNNLSRVLLRNFLGLAQLGAFEMVFKFATLIGFFVVEPFSKIMNVKRFEIADEKDGSEILARIFTLILSVMLFVGLVLSLEVPLILKILTPKEFWLGSTIAALAVFSRIIIASYNYLYFGLLYAKKTYKISLIQISTTVVSVFVCLLLIKPFGILGAVLSSCFTAVFQCMMAYKLATPYYYIPFEWRKIVFVTSFTICLFVLINAITIDGFPSILGWLEVSVASRFSNAMLWLHLDNLFDGKIVSYTVSNIPLLFEGACKLFLSFMFVAVLVLSGILPRQILISSIRSRSLKPILAIGR